MTGSSRALREQGNQSGVANVTSTTSAAVFYTELEGQAPDMLMKDPMPGPKLMPATIEDVWSAGLLSLPQMALVSMREQVAEAVF